MFPEAREARCWFHKTANVLAALAEVGVVAIAVALFARRGLWGLVDEHLNVRLFPVGYWLRTTGAAGRKNGK